MELWVDEEYRDQMQSERVTAPLVGSPAGKLPPVPRDVRKAQRQAEKEKESFEDCGQGCKKRDQAKIQSDLNFIVIV